MEHGEIKRAADSGKLAASSDQTSEIGDLNTGIFLWERLP
jgi:hypothetical protein